MRRRLSLPAPLAPMVTMGTLATMGVIAALAVVLAVFLIARSATPVSAQQILERASAAQSNSSKLQTSPGSQGIQHLRVEVYLNATADPAQSGTTTVMETYTDLNSGRLRSVISQAGSGVLLDVFAYDGTYTYSNRQPGEAASSTPLTIYRSSQAEEKLSRPPSTLTVSPQELFDQFRREANITLVGKETGENGQPVYILRSPSPVKTIQGQDVQSAPGFTIMTFDAATYRLLENRATVQKNGQEIVVSDMHFQVDEILPASQPVTWDLSDLQGIQVVDDPNRKLGDLQPEIITAAELAGHTASAYLLKSIPAGFTLEISAPPQQADGQAFTYSASYRTPAGDYFVLQATGGPASQMEQQPVRETYPAGAGLEVKVNQVDTLPDGRQVISAMFTTPEGNVVLLTSTLPAGQIRQLAQDLVAIK